MDLKEKVKKTNPFIILLVMIFLVLVISNLLSEKDEGYDEVLCGYKCLTLNCKLFIENQNEPYSTYIVKTSMIGSGLVYFQENVSKYECQKRFNKYKPEINKNLLKINDWKNE